MITFSDVTDIAGVSNPKATGIAFGGAWGYFNNDNFPDLYVSNHYQNATLFLNNTDGTFLDIAEQVFQPEDLQPPGGAFDKHGAFWFDFDRDGDQDLFQAAGAREGMGSDPNRLFVNEVIDGQQLFLDRAVELGIDYPFARTRSTIPLDYNLDGLLDVYITAEKRPNDDLGLPTVFAQTSSGVFEDVKENTVPNFSQSTQAYLSDLSGDGRLDLIVKGVQPPLDRRLHILDMSTSPFTDITAELLTNSPQFDSAFNFTNDIAFADFNGDLLPDMYVTRYAFENSSNQLRPDSLFLNTQSGLIDSSLEAGLTNSDALVPGLSIVSGDFDNDMDVDIYIQAVERRPGQSPHPNLFLWNNGNAVFTPDFDTAPGILIERSSGDSAITADYNNDGFLDIYLVRRIGADGKIGNQLYQNDTNENNWLQIDLKGGQSNISGIGTQVFLTAGGVTQLREQNGGSHRYSQNHERLHFGLGSNEMIDKVEFRWPNGTIQIIDNLAVNQIIDIPVPTQKLSGSKGDDILIGNQDDNVLIGRIGDDSMSGNGGNDNLSGNWGDDVLIGGEGLDSLRGGKNNDTLTGNEEADLFIFKNDIAFDSDVMGLDTLTDYQPGEDQLALSKTTFTALSSMVGQTLNESEFGVENIEANADLNSALIVYSPVSGSLFYNPNKEEPGFGDGAQFGILSENPQDLSAADFLIIS